MTRAASQGLRLAALTAAIVLGAANARADGGSAGSSAAAFLAVPQGAAAPGMAGTTIALGGDLSAAESNPASLGWVPDLRLALSHSQLPDGSRHEWASVGGQLGFVPTRWALTGLYIGQSSFEGRDALNQPTGSFSASSSAIGLALAQPLGKHAALGFGTTYVSENLAGTTGMGVTFDAGVIARTGMLAFGASAQNVGGSMRYGGASYGFPTCYGAGLALESPAGLHLEVDANFPESYYNDLRAGAEYRWRERVALRAGYRLELSSDSQNESLTGLSFGMGAGVAGVWLDYAYLPSNVGGDNQRLGIVLYRAKVRTAPGTLETKRTPGTAATGRERKPE